MGAEALLGGLASIVGGGISQFIADDNAEKAFGRQKELMALQNQYAVQNWNRENNYNSPAEQMKRLKEAGLNPNLIYGNGATGLQAGSIDSPSAPSAPMAPTMDFSRAIDSAIQASVGLANAEKAKSETIKQDIENKYLAKSLEEGIKQTQAFTELTKEQKAKVILECQNVAAEWNRMQVEIEGMRKNNALTDKQIQAFDRRLNAELDYLASSSDLNKKQKEILEAEKDDLVRLLKGQADLSTKTAELLNKYGDAQAVIGLIAQVISAGSDLIGTFLPHKHITQIINKYLK